MKRFVLFAAVIVWTIVCAPKAPAAEDKAENAKSQTKAKDAADELKLEDLLPEKPLFGPSASGMAFSHDGKYGAYLYRPYKERRHGADLYIYDVEKGVSQRVTWPSVMARFQKNTRKVVEDRIEKAKKEKPNQAEKKKDQTARGKKDEESRDKPDKDGGKKKEDKDDKDSEKTSPCDEESADKSDAVKDGEEDKDRQDGSCTREKKDSGKDAEGEKVQKEKDEEQVLKERGDWVSDKDADDEKAPKYAGLSDFRWSPTAHKILFESEGDLYLYDVSDGTIKRLTETRDREDLSRWLPDGSGCVFRRERALYRLIFGDDVVRQLDPKFPEGDTFQRYSLSEDGRYVAFVTDKEVKSGPASKVEIASYKNRLMQARDVQRHVSDDPLPVHERRVYVYRLSGADDEKDVLTEVFKCQTQMPDDIVGEPAWSPDSRRVAFLTFEQDPALIKIYEAIIADNKAGKTEAKKESKDSKKKDDGKKGEQVKDEKDGDEKAKEIFRFLHHGGPNTPRMMTLYYLAENRRIVYLSEQSGFRHLHVLDPTYESTRPLTSGPFEVYPIAISKDRKWVFVHATREHPSQTDVYKISTSGGRMVRLTREKGTHSDSAVSDDGTRVLTNLVSYDQLKELVFIDARADVHKLLTDSHPEKAHKFAEPKPEFFDFTNRHGQRLYGMMFKPDDWTKNDRRPVLIYFYGGPLGTRKMVVQGSFAPYNYAFPYYMAKKHGWVACTIDTRGNSGYAGVFEKANFGRVGRPQVEDLVDAVKVLTERYGVDKEKIAIHGWSFGGFQTQMCMYTEPDVFQVGIAGAGPTEWENYNSWYTRHTIGKSEPGQATLKEFSLLPLAKNLKGRLLLVHGMEDDNVLYQDTVRVYRELLKAGKETQVELFLDPTGGHGLGGDVNTLSRYRKYEQFLLQTIGPYKADTKEERIEAVQNSEEKKGEKKK